MIKEFTIGFSRTINLGNYESARVEASVTIAVPEDYHLDHSDIDLNAQHQLKRLLEETWKAQLRTITKDTLK